MTRAHVQSILNSDIFRRSAVLLVTVLLFALPLISLAQVVDVNCRSGDPCGFEGLGNTILNFNNLILTIAVPLATLSFGIAGVMFIISADNESKRTEAKEIIKFTLFGMVFVFGAWILVKTIVSGLGGSDDIVLPR